MLQAEDNDATVHTARVSTVLSWAVRLGLHAWRHSVMNRNRANVGKLISELQLPKSDN